MSQSPQPDPTHLNTGSPRSTGAVEHATVLTVLVVVQTLDNRRLHDRVLVDQAAAQSAVDVPVLAAVCGNYPSGAPLEVLGVLVSFDGHWLVLSVYKLVLVRLVTFVIHQKHSVSVTPTSRAVRHPALSSALTVGVSAETAHAVGVGVAQLHRVLVLLVEHDSEAKLGAEHNALAARVHLYLVGVGEGRGLSHAVPREPVLAADESVLHSVDIDLEVLDKRGLRLLAARPVHLLDIEGDQAWRQCLVALCRDQVVLAGSLEVEATLVEGVAVRVAPAAAAQLLVFNERRLQEITRDCKRLQEMRLEEKSS